jgi:hypothetical protein
VPRGVRWRLTGLTTPISFTTDLPTTSFWPKRMRHSGGYVEFMFNTGSSYETDVDFWWNNPGMILAGAKYVVTKWHVRDAGPDYTFNNQCSLEDDQNETNLMPYDPTNGTVSLGDNYRFRL